MSHIYYSPLAPSIFGSHRKLATPLFMTMVRSYWCVQGSTKLYLQVDGILLEGKQMHFMDLQRRHIVFL